MSELKIRLKRHKKNKIIVSKFAQLTSILSIILSILSSWAFFVTMYSKARAFLIWIVALFMETLTLLSICIKRRVIVAFVISFAIETSARITFLNSKFTRQSVYPTIARSRVWIALASPLWLKWRKIGERVPIRVKRDRCRRINYCVTLTTSQHRKRTTKWPPIISTVL